AVVVGILVAGGIDQREGQIADPADALAPVAGDARRIIDNGELSAHQPVEQRGFADVWPSDDGDGYGHLMPLLLTATIIAIAYSTADWSGWPSVSRSVVASLA